MTTRILVCGGRDYLDRKTLNSVLDTLYYKYLGDIVIIHGKAKGADSLAGEWASTNKVETDEYPAQWGRYGKAAGYYRNMQMVEDGEPDLIVAFPGGKGTAMMIDIAKRVKLPVYLVE